MLAHLCVVLVFFGGVMVDGTLARSDVECAEQLRLRNGGLATPPVGITFTIVDRVNDTADNRSLAIGGLDAGTNFHEFMTVAACMDGEFVFDVETKSWGSYVVSLNGKEASWEENVYWQLIKEPNMIAPVGIDEYHPRDGDHVAMVYKRVDSDGKTNREKRQADCSDGPVDTGWGFDWGFWAGLSMGTSIGDAASTNIGSSDWSLFSYHPGVAYPFQPKCNVFVSDMLGQAGAPVPMREPGKIVGAGEWGNPSSSMVSSAGYSIVNGAPQRGDVISNGSHMGIVAGPGQTISASTLTNTVVQNDWGFRGDEGNVVIWRPPAQR